MIICLVTDRRRADPVSQARRAVRAGIDLIQIRERDLEAAALATLVREILDVTRGSPTRVLVNDRIDVALAARADGTHLRSDSVPSAVARQLLPRPQVITRSVHSAGEAAEADACDFVLAGTVFATSSKPDRRIWLGEAGLRAIVAAAATRVLAIGGLTVDNVSMVARAGASGIAAIGLFAHDRPLDEVVTELRSRFDSVKMAP